MFQMTGGSNRNRKRCHEEVAVGNSINLGILADRHERRYASKRWVSRKEACIVTVSIAIIRLGSMVRYRLRTQRRSPGAHEEVALDKTPWYFPR